MVSILSGLLLHAIALGFSSYYERSEVRAHLVFLFLRSVAGFEGTGSRRLDVKVSFDGKYVPMVL